MSTNPSDELFIFETKCKSLKTANCPVQQEYHNYKIFQALWNAILRQYAEFNRLCSAGHCLSREVTFNCLNMKNKMSLCGDFKQKVVIPMKCQMTMKPH